MKIIKRSFTIALAFCIVFMMSACSGLKLTEEMQNAVDMYKSAIKTSSESNSGKVKVVSSSVDSAIEFKTTESIINFSYEVIEGSVHFERTDYLDGQENAKYRCDGNTVLCFDYESKEWKDKTEENKSFIDPNTNPFITFSLFRVDNNFKIRTDYMSDIRTFETDDGLTAIEFTLKDNTVSDVLKYYKADGIVRQSDGHIRTYYIDKTGKIKRIIVDTVQKMLSNGKEGEYKNTITVTCE